MAAINGSSADVTTLYKFYHTNRDNFFPLAAAATEQADEFYAVTQHTADTGSQSIIRFTKDENSAWESYALKAEYDTEVTTPTIVAPVSGSESGMFARMMGKTYYTNGQDNIKQIRSRSSASDPVGKFLYTAGVPDPNAYRQFSKCDNTGEATYYNGGGAGSCNVTFSVQHRREGIGALMVTQETGSKTALLSITAASTEDKDWTTFTDQTTCGGDDYVALELYRFDKKSINQIELRCGEMTGTAVDTNYFFTYITITGDTTDLDGNTWDNWAPVQNTTQAEWGNNPYDNAMFNVRIRKNHFGNVGSPSWGSIDTVQIRLKSGDNASTTRPAKISVDNIRILKSPPKITSNRIQCATFERQESGSTDGWLADTAAGTKASFNYEFAREGVACVAVADDTTATLTFSTAKDLATFPDGLTADTSCVLRCNVSWKPFGFDGGFNWANFTAPQIKFIDNAGVSAKCTMFTMGNLTGGGLSKQVIMKMADTVATGDGTWIQGAGFDWTQIKKVKITGPVYAGKSPQPFYFDDLRIERPLDAHQPIFVFEPIGSYAITAMGELLSATFQDYAWAIQLTTEYMQWVFGNLSYQTYGMGWMTYPDYEHSSFGIAGCTLHSYGSKSFGARFRFNSTHDLSNYRIPTVNFPPSWSGTDEMGPIKWVDIPAGDSDVYSIWISAPPEEIENIENITIRIFGNYGVAIDTENYLEYTITAEEIKEVQKTQGEGQKEFNEAFEQIKKGLNDNPVETLNHIGNILREDASKSIDFIKEGVRSLGRDRGGWHYGTFEWKRKDMIKVENSETGRQMSLTSVRGIGIELTARGGGATICVDNFFMGKKGNLNGKYWYRVILEDMDGNMSPASDISFPSVLNDEDGVIKGIYVPTGPNKHRVKNKRIYRLGGNSTEWRHAGNCGVNIHEYFDSLPDDKLGLVIPENAYAPPRCKVMKAIGNIMYYANITSDRLDEKFPYRMYKSQPFVPFRVKDTDAIDIPEDKGAGIVTFEEYYNQIAIWTPDSLWTLPVGFKGVPQLRSTKGCIARDSVAKSDYGLIWLAREGIMIGNISKVDDNFFKPINKLFTDYIKSNNEDALSNAKGFIIGQYYYLFYDFKEVADGLSEHNGTGKGICCYLPERTFSELEGPFDMRSFCKWDGGEDNNDIYYGRSDGQIFKLFDGDDDNGTAIITTLRTREFSQPGIQYDKWVRAFYLSLGNLSTTKATLIPTVYVNETAKETMPTWTATTTTVKTFAQPAVQGDEGTHLSVGLTNESSGDMGRHKITDMVIKIEIEDDVERKV